MADTLNEVYDRVFGGEANLSVGERVGSIVVGLAAAAGGLRRGGLPGLLLGLAGGAIAMRGAAGHCALKAAFQNRDSNRQLSGAKPGDRYEEGTF